MSELRPLLHLIQLTSVEGDRFYLNTAEIQTISPVLSPHDANTGIYVGGRWSYCTETVDQVIDALLPNVIEVSDER